MNSTGKASLSSVLRRAKNLGKQEHPLGDTISTLLRGTFSEFDGLALAHLVRSGVTVLAADLAPVLATSQAILAKALAVSVQEAVQKDFLLTGAEVIALLLKDAGVKTAFGYAGTSELSLCDAFARLPEVTIVNARGDKECAFMAAGASLLEPLQGIGILHGARGLTNALGGIADARRNEVATVYVVGLPSTPSAQFLPPHGEEGLIETIGRFTKWCYEMKAVPAEADARRMAARELVEAIHTAVEAASERPHGPTMLGIPQDVAEKAWIPWSIVAEARQPGPAAPPIDSVRSEEVLDLLLAHENPLILVDDYFLKYESGQEVLAAFAARIAAPVLQLRYLRGPMLFERINPSRVPNFVGWFDARDEKHKELLESADLLITIEDRNMYRRVIGEMPGCRKIAINSSAAKVRKNQYLQNEDMLIEGDAVRTLDALNQILAARMNRRNVRFGWAGSAGRDLVSQPGSGTAKHSLRAPIVKVIADALRLREKPIVVDDSQMFGGLVSTEYDLLPAKTRVFGDHGGFVGGGIGFATGLAIGDPNADVFCFLGDQGFTNAFQCLVSAVQEDARVIFIVCNNGESVSLLTQAHASAPLAFDSGQHRFLKNIPGLEYWRMAQGIGVHSWLVDFTSNDDPAAVDRSMAAFRTALEAATVLRGPALVELRLPSRGDFWSGIWLTSGFEEKKPATTLAAVV